MAHTAEPPGPPEARALIEALVELSRAYGSNPELVLAGGGNTSLKLDGHLLVKASGVALANITAEDFVDLDRVALQALLDGDLVSSRDEREAAFKEAVLAARREPGRLQRPSVESVLHHIMPGRFVVHLHATLVNQFSCCREGRRLVEGRLGGEVVWTELVDPGLALAKAVEEGLRSFQRRTGKEPRAVIMQNHGLVVSGRAPGEIQGHIDWLFGELEDIQGQFGPMSKGAPDMLKGGDADVRADVLRRALSRVLSTEDAPATIVFDRSGPVADLVGRCDGLEMAMGGPLTPDQIVYCRSFPMWFSTVDGEGGADLERRLADAVGEYAKAHGTPPVIVLVPGLGLFASGGTEAEAGTARLVYVDAIKVMAGARRMGGATYLDAGFRAFVEHWEVESYRRAEARRRGL